MNPAALYNASTWVIPVVLAVTLHEAAHGWMAERFGDDTARQRGRVTFNPLKHIDPLGTIILPALLWLIHSPVLFGYAKPVPVDFQRLRPARVGMLAVALAGPGMNILLALGSALLLHLGTPATAQEPGWFATNCYHALIINCVLAVFNMIPLLPLDGGRVLRALLPGKLGNAYALTERFGMLVILALLLLPGWLGINIFAECLVGGADFIINLILRVTGNSNFPDIP